MTKAHQANFPLLHNALAKKSIQPLWLLFFHTDRHTHRRKTETYLYRDIHFAFVWTLIQLDRHNSDSDRIAWLVAWSVGLDEGGDVLRVEAEGGGAGEEEAVTPVASHRQVKEGILGYRARNLGRVYEHYQKHKHVISGSGLEISLILCGKNCSEEREETYTHRRECKDPGQTLKAEQCFSSLKSLHKSTLNLCVCNCSVTSLEVLRLGYSGVTICQFSRHLAREACKNSDSQGSGCPSMQHLWTRDQKQCPNRGGKERSVSQTSQSWFINT